MEKNGDIINKFGVTKVHLITEPQKFYTTQ